MAPPLRCVVSVSGIRGIVGETLAADQVLELAAAYAQEVSRGGVVVLGRDSRPTGEMLAQAAAAGLRAAGASVVDIGVVPTPTVPIMARELGADGGIQVSASHNPVEWNALKFFSKDGRNIDQAALDRLISAYGAARSWQRWRSCGRYGVRVDAIDVHIARVLATVNAQAIRARRFTVLLDSVNGAGSAIGPRLLSELGCSVISLHARPDLPFPRDPEPTAANLRQTCALAAAAQADIGFVQDPDADRLAIIDEHGAYIGEEYTLVLCASGRLARHRRASGEPAPVVCTNLSTSRMLEDVAERHGARVVRARVGEANVVDAMQAHGALVGGEGNGGVIDPRVVWGRDSQIAMALVLEGLATSGRSLSAEIAAIPAYAMHKEKVALDRAGVARAIDVLRGSEVARGASIDLSDGLKLSWVDRWLHLRASGTEPVSRIITEAPTIEQARALADRARAAIGAAPAVAHGARP